MAAKLLGLTRGAIQKRVSGIDFQFELFRKAKLETTCAERSVFVLKDETLAALDRGEDIRLDELCNYKLVTRDRPVNIFDTGDNYRSVNGASRYSYAENAAGLKDMTSDETKLLMTGQMVCSVESHETPGFAGNF